MPTETVYGLAAVATNRQAVHKVFAAKARPADNPLIVHISNLEQVTELTEGASREAEELAGAFWPGPLTLVLKKRSLIPDEVTAGRDTVALRMPAHPIAKALIQATGAPLAAPSANRFMALSPTRAQHIAPEVAQHLALILDGGPCEVGIESTVVDCTDGVRILRHGSIGRAQIEAVLGHAVDSGEERTRAPGQYPRHYAPRTRVELVQKLRPEDAGLTFDNPSNPQQIKMPLDPAAYAARLYNALHALDGQNLSVLKVEQPPAADTWEAVWDRLKKASTEG
jgi:L-threonylcarbamoyladenylate synthase